MKKFIALTMAGVMLCALPALAATSPSAAVVASSASTEESPAPASTKESSIPASTEESSIPASVKEAAAAEGKSVGEYTNNAIVEVPGLENVVPTGQGGHVIINGAPSNVIFFLTKPGAATVKAAKSQAAALGGKVLNVFGTRAVVGKFNTAKVNFYMKGVKAGQLIRVYQLVKGEWVEVEVAEIREDHVVVNMTSHGTLAFVEVPAAPAQK